MDKNDVQLVGSPCGQHGPYTFYKAFRFTKNGAKRIMTLSEFFFVKLWMDSDLVCIGELQLLWVDKNSEQVLASLRLYFLPENTPDGRMDHGEDEVLAISEKVVLRVEDLITWITADAEWSWGRLAKCVEGGKAAGSGVWSSSSPASAAAAAAANTSDSRDCSSDGAEFNGAPRALPTPDDSEDELRERVVISPRLTEAVLDFSDVEKERKLLDIKPPVGPAVVILSYPRYCRYRAVMKRLETVEDVHLKHKIVYAIGGIKIKTKHTRILFCKDTFDYPELEGHELLCNHLAPKLKGRPRGKRKKRSISPGSESNESESSVSNVFNLAKNKIMAEGSKNGLKCDSARRSTRATENTESKDFIKQLTAFMKGNHTPIGRIPSLGYRELDLYSFYAKVQKLGGYDVVTTNRLWKSIFDDLSGNQSSTSAATVIRRHYERFLLPYERHVKGEEYKPLPISERRRLKSKAGSSSTSDTENSEGGSRSGNSTPVPQPPPGQTPQTSTVQSNACNDNKDFSLKLEAKPSSLRAVRVKPDRLRENVKDKTADLPEIIEEKIQEPTTGAVAPVQKPVPTEKSMSPAEGKENIPVYNVQDSPEDDDDLIEVPYKPESPEIIDLESDAYASKTPTSDNNNSNTNNNNNNNVEGGSSEVKRGKLDILKEGGLEVTPVRGFVGGEQRATVIQQSVVERPIMPPPSINASLIKRPVQLSPSLQISPRSKCTTQNFPCSPPKVVQSKSIYAPSQRTVYGDPKDLFGPQIHQVQTPKFVGGPTTKCMDLLDLTVRSPQKPVVEIMRVPPIIPSPKLNVKDTYTHPKNFNTPALPLLEGRRISSNLEITLVGPSKSKQPVQHQPPTQNKYSPHAKQSQKRGVSADYYMPPTGKISKLEENGRHLPPPPYPSKPASAKQSKADLNIPKPMSQYVRQQSAANNKQENNKYPPTSTYQNFMPPHHPASSNKNLPQYLPVMDAMYYQALQNICTQQNQLNSLNPVFPMPTPEQLHLYSEMMTRNASRMPFSFPQHFYSPDGHSLDGKVKKQ